MALHSREWQFACVVLEVLGLPDLEMFSIPNSEGPV